MCADALVIFGLHMFEVSLKKQKEMIKKMEEEGAKKKEGNKKTKNQEKAAQRDENKESIKKALNNVPKHSVFGNPFHTIQLPDKKKS